MSREKFKDAAGKTMSKQQADVVKQQCRAAEPSRDQEKFQAI